MLEPSTPQGAGQAERRWQPLSAIDRRVAGVLVEKAKTTPDNYPMSLSAVVSACNQKSNRFPVMNLEPADVEESLDRLREIGAVGLVQGLGRVAKYRHYLYEWLGVEKVELAVMAELLLRGPQSEGDLRAHVSRMEPIADLGTLRSILAGLKAKGLVIPLSPEGRGHVVTHGLYPARELERIRAEFAAGRGSVEGAQPSGQGAHAVPNWPTQPPAPTPTGQTQQADTLRHDLAEVRKLVVQLRQDVDRLAAELQQARDDLQCLKRDLGV